MENSLNAFVGQTLTWVPTAAFKDRYELVASDNTVLATLDMSNWTSKASVQVPEGTLLIQKDGWSGLKVVSSLDEQGQPLATYKGKWSGTSGQLLFPDGREFKWSKGNFWGSKKVWTDSADATPYVQFSNSSFSRKSTVEIGPQAAEIPELSLLLALGLYNILLERRNAAAAGAAAAT